MNVRRISLLSMLLAMSLCVMTWAQSNPEDRSRTDPDRNNPGKTDGTGSGGMGGSGSQPGMGSGAGSGTGGGNMGSGTTGSDRGNMQDPNRTGTDRMGTDRMGTDRSGMGMGNMDTQMNDQKHLRQLQMLASDANNAPDKLFIMHVAMGNQWETQFGQLVNERASDQKVKDLAKMVADDHQQNQQKVREVAQKLGVEISDQLSGEKQAKLSIFRQMSPEKLEQCYLADMKADHAADITSFTDHAALTQNDQLKSYINETLPKLKAHSKQILNVASQKGLPGDFNNLTAQNAAESDLHASK